MCNGINRSIDSGEFRPDLDVGFAALSLSAIINMSLDVKNVPVGVVLEDNSPTAKQATAFVNGSDYFSPVYISSMKDAETALMAHRVDAILRIPGHFTQDLAKGNAQVQVIVNGVEATSALSAQTYMNRYNC